MTARRLPERPPPFPLWLQLVRTALVVLVLVALTVAIAQSRDANRRTRHALDQLNADRKVRAEQTQQEIARVKAEADADTQAKACQIVDALLDPPIAAHAAERIGCPPVPSPTSTAPASRPTGAAAGPAPTPSSGTHGAGPALPTARATPTARPSSTPTPAPSPSHTPIACVLGIGLC